MGNNHSQFSKKRKVEDTWNFDIDIDDENDIDIVASFIEENPFLFNDVFNDETNTRDGRENKKNYWTTPWGVMLRHPDIKNPTTKLGRLFRRRFRVQFPIFDEILVRRCREKNIFDIKSEKCVRIPM